MTQQTHIPEGYQQTEVGIIPEDWEVKKLGEVSSMSSGTTPSRALEERYYQNGNIFWVKTTDLNNSNITDTSEKITELALKEVSSLKVYNKGTVLVAMYGGFNQIGRTGILNIPATVNQALTAIQPNKNLDSHYLINYLNFRNNYWKDVAISSRKDPNITSKDIKAFPISLPPTKAEQQAIATALSNSDALISSLEQLIAKKRNIKQGVMQQLLTPKDDWQVKKLGDVAPLQRGFDLPNPKLKVGKYPVVYSNGILNYHITYKVKGPGVITGRSGTIGKVTFIDEDYWPHNTSLWVTDFKNNNPLFIYYLYNYIGLERFATGSGVPTLNRNDVHSFSVAIPKPIEQASTAQILSDMDAEIEALEQKLNKYKLLKQGMMQNLLTGKIRVI